MTNDGVISLTGLDEEVASTPDRDLGLDITPKRTLMYRVSYPPRPGINAVLISLLCFLILVMIGFVPVNLPSPMGWGQSLQGQTSDQMIRYTFQLPLALFMAAFLGPFMGTGIVLLFLGLGLTFFPLFANGGGWHYVFEPGFGYLVGMLVSAFVLGKSFYRVFQKQGKISRSLKILAKTLAALVLLHLVGMAYLPVLALLGQLSWAEVPGWALRLTIETAPYDFIATFVFLCLVRPFRALLSLALY